MIVVAPVVREARLAPRASHDVEPFLRARVPIVVFIERRTEAPRLVLPPGRHDVEREPAVGNVVDVRRLLREYRRRMERWPHGNHDLELFRDRREGGGRRPRVERRRVDPLDVVEQQLGDQREVVADLFAALRKTSHVVPRRRHPLMLDVAQPTAEDGEPVSVSHMARGVARAARDARGAAARPTESANARSASLAMSNSFARRPAFHDPRSTR